MNHEKITIKRALLSVSDKSGIIDFAKALAALNIEIISTGGTYKVLNEANIPVREITDFTGFPEIMDGRVKTLHPKVHGGILGLRDSHRDAAKENEIDWIDLVVVHLYPFAETIKKPHVSFDEAIEQIDIGGPAMIRSAAKNMGWVGVVVDPEDYAQVLTELTEQLGLTFMTRKTLAIKAFALTAEYDHTIQHYLATQETHRFVNSMQMTLEKYPKPRDDENAHQKTTLEKYPERRDDENIHLKTTASQCSETQKTNHFVNSMQLHLEKWAELRYGENPHQTATAYQLPDQPSGILAAKQYQGKQLSFNNILDADAALSCVEEFTEPACVIVKHANPCGVAMSDAIHQAFTHAFAADSLSAFGGVVALNRECDKATADAMIPIFFEVIIAPHFTAEALALFASKPNLRILELSAQKPVFATHEFRFIRGGVLLQDRDISSLRIEALSPVTLLQPKPADLQNILFAYQVVKHVKSNAIVIAKQNVTLGIGAGQVSRVDAVESALKKAGNNTKGAVLASDAFFPFRDSIDRLAGTGIQVIIQPGGSVRDEEVIAACNELGIAMVFTGVRNFKH